MAGKMRKLGVWLGLVVPSDEDVQEPQAADPETAAEETEAVEVEAEAESAQVASVTDIESKRPQIADIENLVSVQPESYSGAKIVGEHYLDGALVVIDLTGLATADAKRLVDFSAGLIFATGGNMARLTKNVFLLTPESVKLEAEQKEAIVETLATGELPNLVAG
jgi:cell division inhibitor SepF